MTENQIKAINDAMSFIGCLDAAAKGVSDTVFSNWVRTHSTELAENGFPSDVAKHFEGICFNIHRDVNGQG